VGIPGYLEHPRNLKYVPTLNANLPIGISQDERKEVKRGNNGTRYWVEAKQTLGSGYSG